MTPIGADVLYATRFGLGCNVYTRDPQTIFRCMRAIKAGTVWSTTR